MPTRQEAIVRVWDRMFDENDGRDPPPPTPVPVAEYVAPTYGQFIPVASTELSPQDRLSARLLRSKEIEAHRRVVSGRAAYVRILENVPRIHFGKRYREWEEEVQTRKAELDTAEYDLMKYTDPEAYAETEEAIRPFGEENVAN